MGLGDTKWSIELMAASEALPRFETDRVQTGRTPKCFWPMAVNARQIETLATLLGCGRPILLRLGYASPLIKFTTAWIMIAVQLQVVHAHAAAEFPVE